MAKDCKGSAGHFRASAGATVLVTVLVVVPYFLSRLRQLAPKHTKATLDWRKPLGDTDLLLFEAFVTDQRKVTDTRHVEDAKLAIAAFRAGIRDPATFDSAITEPVCLNLLGAAMLRTGWTTDPAVLAEPCLVVTATGRL